MRDKLARRVMLHDLQLLHDFGVDSDIYRKDPECRDAAYAEADIIIAALPDMVKPLVWVEGGSDSFMHDADFVDTTQTYQIQEGLFWYAAEVQGVPCGSNEAAKVAAQAHHVAQVLSAFGIEGDG